MPLSDYSLHDQATLFLARPKLELSGPDPFKQIFANFAPRPHLALLTGPCHPLPGSELTSPSDSVHAVVVTARTPLPIEGEVQYFTELLKLKGEIKNVCRCILYSWKWRELNLAVGQGIAIRTLNASMKYWEILIWQLKGRQPNLIPCQIFQLYSTY